MHRAGGSSVTRQQNNIIEYHQTRHLRQPRRLARCIRPARIIGGARRHDVLPSFIHTRAIETSDARKTTRGRAEVKAGFEPGFVDDIRLLALHAARRLPLGRLPLSLPRRSPRRIRIVASLDDGSRSFARVARRGAALRARAASPRATTHGEEREPTLATTRRFGCESRRILRDATTPVSFPIPSTADHARLRVRRTIPARIIVERHMDREGRFASPRSSAAGSVASPSRSSSREPSGNAGECAGGGYVFVFARDAAIFAAASNGGSGATATGKGGGGRVDTRARVSTRKFPRARTASRTARARGRVRGLDTFGADPSSRVVFFAATPPPMRGYDAGESRVYRRPRRRRTRRPISSRGQSPRLSPNPSRDERRRRRRRGTASRG